MADSMEKLAHNSIIINNFQYHDYHQIVVEVNDSIVDYNIDQIEYDCIALQLAHEVKQGDMIKIKVANEIFQGDLKKIIFYVFGLVISLGSAPEPGLLGIPLENICIFRFMGPVELTYEDGSLILDGNADVICNRTGYLEDDYRIWFRIMFLVVNIFSFIISILIFMTDYTANYVVFLLIFLFMNGLLYLYSRKVKKKIFDD